MLELIIRDRGSLLPVVLRRDISLEQLEAIKRIIDKDPLEVVVERKLKSRERSKATG